MKPALEHDYIVKSEACRFFCSVTGEAFVFGIAIKDDLLILWYASNTRGKIPERYGFFEPYLLEFLIFHVGAYKNTVTFRKVPFRIVRIDLSNGQFRDTSQRYFFEVHQLIKIISQRMKDGINFLLNKMMKTLTTLEIGDKIKL